MFLKSIGPINIDINIDTENYFRNSNKLVSTITNFEDIYKKK